jgi:hypothetical protein
MPCEKQEPREGFDKLIASLVRAMKAMPPVERQTVLWMLEANLVEEEPQPLALAVSTLKMSERLASYLGTEKRARYNAEGCRIFSECPEWAHSNRTRIW